METASARFNDHAAAVANKGPEAGEAAGTLESERAFEANEAVAKTADKMVGTLLNALA